MLPATLRAALQVCHVMKIKTDANNPDTGQQHKGLLTHQSVCFSPDVLATADKMPAMT